MRLHLLWVGSCISASVSGGEHLNNWFLLVCSVYLYIYRILKEAKGKDDDSIRCMKGKFLPEFKTLRQSIHMPDLPIILTFLSLGVI